MAILVTGAAGFTAHHLAELLSINGEITSSNDLYFTSSKLVKPEYCKNYIACDLTNSDFVYSLIDMVRPLQIYHLAGSFSNQYESDYASNVLSTKNIFDAILKVGIKPKILLIGSAAEYGVISSLYNPVNENQALNPVSIYGLTKVFQTQLMKYYFDVHKLNIVMARTFNIYGPGISNLLFIGKLNEQIKKYKQHELEKITIGNLKNSRDYIDIKDAVKWYQIIMEKGVAGEIYNVGSGESILISDLLDRILAIEGLNREIVEEAELTTGKLIDPPSLTADLSKIRALLC